MVIVVFFISVTIFDIVISYKSYAYIKDVCTENDNIIITVDGANGDSKYHHYEFNELGDGVYELQLYASIINGKLFPIDIKINNESGLIKEIRQKPNIADGTGKEYEIIYPFDKSSISYK